MTPELSAARKQASRAREYADMLEHAPVHEDMVLSLTHTYCADVLRECAAALDAALDAAEQGIQAERRCRAEDAARTLDAEQRLRDAEGCDGNCSCAIWKSRHEAAMALYEHIEKSKQAEQRLGPHADGHSEFAERYGEWVELRQRLATLEQERERYRVQVEERYGAVAQWKTEAETNRQAWLKAEQREALRALVEQWRGFVDPKPFGTEAAYLVYCEARQECADKISALLSVSPQEPPA